MFSDTILHYAVFHNKQELCRYLISHGADPHKLNKVKFSNFLEKEISFRYCKIKKYDNYS